MVSRPKSYRRILESIAAFTKERVERSTFDRIRKKQSDADEIKKWDKELTRAYERFSVGVESDFCWMLTETYIDRRPATY
jgi:hypothetical protein